ncbi:MAG: protein kinase [Deltaproteobacteria bacterium]|nr:protein kinase [Deltaproteobacteria bacterium]
MPTPEEAAAEEPAPLPEDAVEGEAPAEEEVDELIGRNIGSYIITKPLGKGGMGAVYAAEHPVIGSRVAVKFLHPQYATDKKIVDRFFNEARAVNVIGHDNILKIIDLNVTEDNRHYFIMEFLIGRALQKLVEDGNPVPLSEAGPILLQFCEALEAAHSHKIYHRDIKPDNVYLIVHKGRKNFVKVVDFGIAKLTGEGGASTGQTQTGMVMGTPAYMSPEQAGGMTNRIDARSDIYSTGCMMFQMATGKLPFPGSSFGEVLIGHLQLPPPNPRELNAEIPEAYEAVILKALSKKQEDRQQTMKELHDEIKAVMDEQGISAELPLADESEMPKSSGPSKELKQLTQARATKAASNLNKTQAQRPSSRPNVTPAPQGTVALAPPPEPPKKTGLIVGIVGGVILLAVIVGVVMMLQAQERQRHESERLAHEAAERATKLAREQAEEERKKELAEEAAKPVVIKAVSEQIDTKVEVKWTDNGAEKVQTGDTPWQVELPRNARVRFTFKKAGFQDNVQDIIADTSQTVTAKLVAEVKAPPKDDKKKEIKKKRELKPGEDEPIDVDF